MTYQGAVSVLPLPPVISTMSAQTIGEEEALAGGGAPTSATWPAVRRVIYVPLFLSSAYRVVRLFWVNGAAVSGNVDCGIYTSVAGLPVTKIVSSGSVAQSGTSAIQTATVDQILAPGDYFLALMVDNTTATIYRRVGVTGVMFLKVVGLAQETPGAFPLPATATPIAISSAYLPVFGIASVTLI